MHSFLSLPRSKCTHHPGIYSFMSIMSTTIRQCLAFNPFASNFVDNPLSIERPGIGSTLLYLFFEGFVYFTLTLLIQVHLAIANICIIMLQICVYIAEKVLCS